MDILWVTPQLPCLRSGGQVRQFHLLKQLSQRHCITVLSLVQEAEWEDIPALKDLGVELIVEPFSPPEQPGRWRNRLQSWSQLLLDPWPHYGRTYDLSSLQKQLTSLFQTEYYDIVHIEHLFAAPLGNLVDGVPWILSEHNIESRILARWEGQIEKAGRHLWTWIEAKKLARWERHWVRRSTACIIVSEDEATALRAMAPDTPTYVVPNGVDTAAFHSPNGVKRHPFDLLFFGRLDYGPNIDALIYFCQEILPLIHEQRPEVMLNIIGGYAPQEVIALGQQSGVRYIGFVDDVRTHLWQNAVCVVPLRIGGGTRLKILEALAACCPVVSTSIGAEGLDLNDSQDLLIADDPKSFAHQILQLLDQPVEAANMACNGRELVSHRYDWAKISQRLEEVYRIVASARDIVVPKEVEGLPYA